jgi:malonyl-CoA decarboxylase
MPDRAAPRASLLHDLLQAAADQGRQLMSRTFGQGLAEAVRGRSLKDLLAALLSNRGEASGVAIAREIMTRYLALPPPERRAVLRLLAERFSPDPESILDACRRFGETRSPERLRALLAAVEPPRQELIRRLNLAPGNTLGLVRMREDLLDAMEEEPDLADVDADFRHLFGSWFNRGFLMMRRIDWSTPAHILEKIIRYEAVHAIESWDDLRRRLEPPDRRCFAFFHPALADEPLIFVEVALTREIPAAIQPILAAGRAAIPAEEATAAVFYSISNCQKGLTRISFGNFLIKQVAEELKREFPALSTFATLSPLPGFGRWAASTGRLALAEPDQDALAAASADIRRSAAEYLLAARTGSGRPLDPVQRFHLGNGARLERINLLADLSRKGVEESLGVMVNYLYDLDTVEANHERFAEQGEVVVSQGLRREFASLMAKRDAMQGAATKAKA